MLVFAGFVKEFHVFTPLCFAAISPCLVRGLDSPLEMFRRVCERLLFESLESKFWEREGWYALKDRKATQTGEVNSLKLEGEAENMGVCIFLSSIPCFYSGIASSCLEQREQRSRKGKRKLHPGEALTKTEHGMMVLRHEANVVLLLSKVEREGWVLLKIPRGDIDGGGEVK